MRGVANRYNLAMKRIHWLLILAIGLPACQAAQPVNQSADGQPVINTELTHGYTMLHKLVEQLAQVDGILVLKSATDDTKSVIKSVAVTSGNAKKQIEQFARDDATISLDDSGLPEAEIAVREAIKGDQTKALLFGDKFEIRLISSQIRGCDYGEALANYLAKSDENEARSKAMKELSETFKNLSGQLVKRLKVDETKE